ncbi:MAG: hypothetical protein LUE89_11870 [Clostridiales bacterium]|nr:hypothetical protein [Clostridiales bacterium]
MLIVFVPFPQVFIVFVHTFQKVRAVAVLGVGAPRLVTAVNLSFCDFPLLCHGNHAAEFLPLPLDVGRVYDADDLASAGQTVGKAQQLDSVLQRVNPGFGRVQLKLHAAEILRYLPVAGFEAFPVLVDEDKVIHVPQVPFDTQLFLDEVVKRTEDRYSGDLYHLAAGVISHVALILIPQYALCPLVDSWRELLCEGGLCYGMAHVGVIAAYVALQNIAVGSVFPVKLVKELVENVPRKVGAFPFLTGCIGADELFTHGRVYHVVIKTALIHTVTKGDAYGLAWFWMRDKDFLLWAGFVGSVL